MLEAYAAWVLRLRWIVIVLMLALVAGIGSGVTKLRLSSNLEVFFPADDPDMLEFNRFRDEFVQDDNIMFTVTPADGAVFTAGTLAAIEDLTTASWQMPHMQRVDSLTNFQYSRAVDDDLQVAPLVENPNSLSAEQLAAAKRDALGEPALLGRLISAKAHVAGVFVTINMPKQERMTAVTDIILFSRALRDRMHADYPDITVRIGGKVAGNFGFTEATQFDLRTIVPLALALALLCIGFYLFYASGSILSAASGVFAVIVIIVTSVLCGLGTAGHLGMPITPPMANAPTMILTLAVADSMHILVTFFQRLRSGVDRQAAMAYSLKLNFQAVLLTSITTVIGFMALNFSDSPPFGDLGNVVAIGIAAAWLISITLLPAIIVVLPIRVHREHNDEVRLMEALASWVIEKRVAVVAVVGGVMLLLMAFIPRNELYDVWAEYFDERVEVRSAIDYMRANLTGMNTIEFSLGAGGEGDIADPAYLARVEAFSDWLRAHPNVVHVSSLADTMKRLNRNMNGDDPAAYRLPEQRDLAAQYLLLYELSLPFGLDMGTTVNLDKSSSRVVAALHDSSTLTVFGLQEDAQAWLRENAPPEMFHMGISSDVMFASVGRSNIVSMLQGSLLGLLAISLVLTLALRSFRLGLLSLFANALPIAVGFGIWGLINGRVGLGLSVVAGVTMGIVVDFTVHLLSKYRMALAEQGQDAAAAIRYAFGTVGVALVVTTVILVVNFGLLLFSSFTLNADLGTLTAIIILLALLVDLLLLPPALLWLQAREKQPDGVVSPAT